MLERPVLTALATLPAKYAIDHSRVALDLGQGKSLTVAWLRYFDGAKKAGALPYSYSRFSRLCQLARSSAREQTAGSPGEASPIAHSVAHNDSAEPYFDAATGLLWIECPGCTLRMRDGALRVETRASIHVFDPAKHRLRYVDLAARGGAVTCDAIAWLSEHDVFLVLASGSDTSAWLDATFLSASGAATGHAAMALRRAQWTALGNPKTTLNVAKAVVLGKERRRPGVLVPALSRLTDAQSIGDVTRIEGSIASVAWKVYKGRPIIFSGAVPAHWKVFSGRVRTTRRAAYQFIEVKDARDPANAMLSYGYRIGLGQCARALAARGLDPTHGFLHVEKAGRLSLAYDAIELIRGKITQAVFAYIALRRFAASDFATFEGGFVRLGRTVAREVAIAVL